MDSTIAILAMLPAFALGWLLVRLARLGNLLFEIALGAGLGAAISSAVYFLLVWAGIASRGAVLACEAILLALAAALRFAAKSTAEPRPAVAPPSWIWLLRGAALLGLCVFAVDFSQTVAANPEGEYDAAAIWNLRARYLAAGSPAWRYAVSDRTGTDHPGYPLLTSAFVARTWVLLGDTRSVVPAALSLVFTLAAFAVLAAGLTCLAGEVAGWLALLVLLASEGYISQAAAQYADVPLSFFILASLTLLAIAESRELPPRLLLFAGLLAGFAAWTKNEGIVFAVFLAGAALWRGGARALGPVAAGVAPGLLLTLTFKLLLVEGREAMFPTAASQGLAMIADPARWIEIAESFAKTFFELGFPWAHPILLLAILAWACGGCRKRAWLLAAPLGLLAADFGIYLISATGLTWHLGTSNNRVIAQVWPAIVFASAAMLSFKEFDAPAAKQAAQKKKQAARR